ncbi:MAG: arginyl-tRNA synthetase [Candidatus Latescibacterota bacterium]
MHPVFCFSYEWSFIVSNPFVEEIAQQVAQITELAVADVVAMMETPPKPEMGDYAFPCFTLAKTFRKAPNLIAEELAGKIQTGDRIAQAKPIGPYLNFFVSKGSFVGETLSVILTQGADFGRSDVGKDKTVVIDFSHPNIAKPFGIHHLRSTVIGNSLRNIHRALGYDVVGVNHLGDWGSQFAKLILAWNYWGEGELTADITIQKLLELYIRIHEEIEDNPELEEEARGWLRRLEAGDEEAVRMWQICVDVSFKEFDRVYQMLGIEFESIAGESFYQDKMSATLERLTEKGLLKKSEGATIVDLEKWDMPPLIALRSDDATLYGTRDLAAAEYRWETYKFEKLLYVVDVAQSLHFKQLFKVLDLMQYDWVKKCTHVVFGRLSFKGGGGASTRKGNVIFLEDVLNRAIELAREIITEKNPDLLEGEQIAQDVGIGALIFADLDSRRARDIVFDWDEVLNFSGETGPYVQYTHARYCSMLRRFEGDLSPENVDFERLNESETLEVVKCLERYPKQIQKAADEHEPSTIALYLIELCTVANRFYNAHQVISEDAELTQSRVALVYAIKTVLASGLALLGMKAPERM